MIHLFSTCSKALNPTKRVGCCCSSLTSLGWVVIKESSSSIRLPFTYSSTKHTHASAEPEAQRRKMAWTWLNDSLCWADSCLIVKALVRAILSISSCSQCPTSPGWIEPSYSIPYLISRWNLYQLPQSAGSFYLWAWWTDSFWAESRLCDEIANILWWCESESCQSWGWKSQWRIQSLAVWADDTCLSRNSFRIR